MKSVDRVDFNVTSGMVHKLSDFVIYRQLQKSRCQCRWHFSACCMMPSGLPQPHRIRKLKNVYNTFIIYYLPIYSWKLQKFILSFFKVTFKQSHKFSKQLFIDCCNVDVDWRDDNNQADWCNPNTVSDYICKNSWLTIIVAAGID